MIPRWPVGLVVGRASYGASVRRRGQGGPPLTITMKVGTPTRKVFPCRPDASVMDNTPSSLWLVPFGERHVEPITFSTVRIF